MIDWVGRTRKTIGAEGMITYHVYKDDETRTYPAWDTSSYKTLLPIRITKTDKERRDEDVLTLKNSVTPTKDGSNEPTGAETYGNSDLATRTVNTYNIAGILSDTDRYHNFPASGDGTRYTHYYRTTYEYDGMGRGEYIIADISDESTYDREQVTRYYYDFLGRRIKVEEGVSDNTHDITSGKPTLNTMMEVFYDDPNGDSTPEQGEGDGNVSWVRRYYGTGAGQYEDTENRYDERNRRYLTIPPEKPYTLVRYDNLNRVTATGTYKALLGLNAGSDPATTSYQHRLDLGKTYFDERGQVYKTETYDDPSDVTPADALASNTYRDRRGLVWASDPANTGVSFIKYDGAQRRTQTMKGTQFDTAKYTGNAPDYPDDDEGIFHVVDYTMDEVGKVTKTISKELNHDDTDGMDLTNNDDYIRTYAYNWYDDAHRLTDRAHYSTNNSDGWKDNSTAPTYGASAPSRSDTVLVTTYRYDSEGRRDKVTDPKAIDTVTVYDKLGRTTAKVEDESGLDRKTEYEYSARGSLARIIHDLNADNTYSNGVWTMVGSDTDQVTEYAYTDSQNARLVKEIRYPTGDGTVGSTQEDKIVFTYNVDGSVATRTDQNGTVLTWSYDGLRRKTEEEVTTVGSYTGGTGAVDGAIRSLTWSYDNEDRPIYVTSHTDTTPDTSTWTDAENQIKHTYNYADKRTKEEQEVDGKVDGSPAVDYGYGTDYTSTGNYNRRDYVEYPDGRKIWFGYTHSDTANTLQDTVNDKFNRVGQIARDNSGSIGDLLAQYDFNGIGRQVRRVHDEATGAYGNDTRMDLWHGTSGDYDGLDRFGRIVDMKHTDFSGTATDFINRKYTHDRNGNRLSIEHVLYGAASQSFTYDALNRLTEAKDGQLDSNNVVQASDVLEGLNMDLLGNFTSTAGGVKLNDTSSTITHAINATNEITSASRANPAGAATLINDPFTTSLSSFWTADKGTWSISSGKVNVDTLTSGDAVLIADPNIDMINFEVEVTFPMGSSTNKAGIIFCHDGNNSYYAVVLNRSAGQLALYQVSSGSWGSALASDSSTINDSTAYTIKVMRKQGHIDATVSSGGGALTYDSSTELGTGQAGLYSDKTDVTFDDFKAHDAPARDSMTPRFGGLAATSLVSGELSINGYQREGEVVIENLQLDDHMVQVTADLNSYDAEVWVRYTDANNGYRFRFLFNGYYWLDLDIFDDGASTRVIHMKFEPTGDIAIKIKLSGSSLKCWIDGSLKIDVTDSTHAAGRVALSGYSPKFDNLKIGKDNSDPPDDDIDDAGDDLFVNEDFSSSSVTVAYDKAGNLVDDGTFYYVYDAWNRLVKVRAKLDDATIQTAEFDAMGRRMKKVVANSGDYEQTVLYLYDGQKIIETRDGSNNMVQQFIHGTQYIDELVMMRVAGKGDLYVHQDANWNVVALTDLGGSVVERNYYTPYGELTVNQDTSYGDRDGDGDVDAADKGTPGTDCTGTVSGACRILDLDFDGDYDSTDATAFDSLPQGLARHPGRLATAVSQPFAHQGILYEPEISSYQDRARQYLVSARRFAQRDQADYADGMSAYQYVGSNPERNLDPGGLLVWSQVSETGISGKYIGGLNWKQYEVPTELGTPINAFWQEDDPRYPDEQEYNCHGYTFGVDVNMWGGKGPMGLGMDPPEVWWALETILEDDKWVRTNCCDAEIFIQREGESFTHSGWFKFERMGVSTDNRFDEALTLTASKQGYFGIFAVRTLQNQVQKWGGQYKCYVWGDKNTVPEPERESDCCTRGVHEAPWP